MVNFYVQNTTLLGQNSCDVTLNCSISARDISQLSFTKATILLGPEKEFVNFLQAFPSNQKVIFLSIKHKITKQLNSVKDKNR